MTKPKIHIIGAGPVGLSCGIFALEKGYQVNIITESSEVAHIAGLAAGGMLAPAYECLCQASHEFSDFAFSARRLWDDFIDKLKITISPNALSLGETPDEINFLERQKIASRDFGFDFNFVKVPDGLKTKAALKLQSDGLLNPMVVYPKMLELFKHLGGNILYDEVLALEEGIVIARNQNYNAEVIIVAAGFQSNKLKDFLPELKHLYPTRGQVIEIDYTAPIDGSIRYHSTYIMSRQGKTIIGATSQNYNDDWTTNQEDVDTLYNNACELYPEFKGKNIINTRAGLRPNTDDEMPILGQSSKKGIFLATGAYRNGWLFAPHIGKYVVESIVKDPLDYSYKRFLNQS